MKRILFLMCLVAAIGANAQEKMIIKETFENNRLRWDEFFEKDCSCNLGNGYLELQNKKDGWTVWNSTELPVSPDANFKITSRILVPKLNDTYFFGILFNYEDENNYSSFMVSEKRFRLYNKTNGTNSLSRHNSIILNSGRNKEVVIEMEKRGDKLTFCVDGMEALKMTKRINYSTFGFIVNGANTIKVLEVDIEYDVYED